MTATSSITEVDELIAEAIVATSATWQYIPGAPEPALERSLMTALRRSFNHVDSPSRATFAVPDWDPCPRGIDVLIRHPNRRPRIPMELKVGATDQTLWDAYKLTAFHQLPEVEATYLICAAKETTWRSGRNCVELFPAELQKTIVLDSVQLFQRNRAAWAALLRGGPARPIRITAHLEVTTVARETCALEPAYELRAVRIHPNGKAILFEGDWPAVTAV